MSNRTHMGGTTPTNRMKRRTGRTTPPKNGSLSSKGRPLSAEKRAEERASLTYRDKNGELAKYRDPTSPFYGLPLPVDGFTAEPSQNPPIRP